MKPIETNFDDKNYKQSTININLLVNGDVFKKSLVNVLVSPRNNSQKIEQHSVAHYCSCFSARNGWCTLKESVLRIGSSIPHLYSLMEVLMCPIQVIRLLKFFFDEKQSTDVVDYSVFSHRRTKLDTFAFSS